MNFELQKAKPAKSPLSLQPFSRTNNRRSVFLYLSHDTDVFPLNFQQPAQHPTESPRHKIHIQDTTS